MSRTLPRIVALAPGGPMGRAVAIAATRAGGLGMLDMTGGSAESVAEAARAVTALGDDVAIRIDPRSADAEVLAALPPGVRTVCVQARAGCDWESAVRRVADSGRVALAEVTSREEAERAGKAGASGVILAGHEAGGLCGEPSSFVLLQSVLASGGPPAWVRGGIGPKGAAGCMAAGASGVVLDGALLLARESPLDPEIRAAIARLDGAETIVRQSAEGEAFRGFAPPGSVAQRRWRAEEAAPSGELAASLGWSPGLALPIGQDAAFASPLAARFVTTGGIVRAVEEAIDRGIVLAAEHRPLSPGSPLAQDHGTRYPIVQGPMTRVSDTVAFAESVADGGALPFLALAMLRGEEVRRLLDEARSRLGDRPWGVGLLGFVTPDLRREQVEAIRAARPPFALIAGGRPDQARELESEGIRTYLHAPSPGLLAQYLKDGARRFVLEGRECGGHVGPRSSLVLWEQAIGILQDFVDRGNAADALHVLFAGGIHDARSSAAVAAMAAPLAARGARIGVLAGTAYLFTEEAVRTGAIVPRFQAEALRCGRTILLETGPGHEVRVGPSPSADVFASTRRALLEQGRPAEEVRAELERLNAGRLRVAAKGVDRLDGAGSPLVEVVEAEQYERGVYMLGQVATLRDHVTTIETLHRDISEGGAERIAQSSPGTLEPDSGPRPSDIAIVGMSAIFPGAPDLRTFWENTLKGVNAITEVPPDRWDWRTYYDPDPKAPDKVVSKWGGFVPDVPFDPLRYGMPPTTLPSIEPVQLLVLEAVRRAIDDAGYSDRPFPRERTAVVLGMGGGAAQVAMGYAFRSYLPMLESVAPEAGKAAREAAEPLLPEWTEDSFPGFLLNVAAGRVANRFDLGGANYTVDAACGSSLAAASLAVRELETGAADMIVLGGADTVQNPLTYLAFSKTHAFSPRGRCRPFDASADGIVISEGVGVVILKRLSDAERDGDRIYAVIKGMGSSSDGRARGLTAPNIDGQTRALHRAYHKAGVDPATIGYVEAHGTGTAVGDVVEVNALSGLLREAGAAHEGCAVGSVKSMIGHTKCAAGIAGLINASLALHRKVLPPTIGVETLNPKADLAEGPLRVSTRPRPWFHADGDRPRRAGVSAFGFGGTNFHAVLESYDRNLTENPAPLREWPAELFLWRAESPEALHGRVGRLLNALDAGAAPRPRDLAHALAGAFDATRTDAPTLAIVAGSIGDLREKLTAARDALAAGEASFSDPRGIEYAARPAFAGAKAAFLFPGQGAQSLEMLDDLALAFPEVREAFEGFDLALSARGRSPITPRVFPPTTLDEHGRRSAERALRETDVAQPAVGAASVGMLRLLGTLGLQADFLAGHSYGELVALHAAGCLSADSLAVLSETRGRLMREAAGPSDGAMVAILAGPDRVRGLLGSGEPVVIANLNGPRQTVISGPRDAVNRVSERARSSGLRAVDLPVACAFHSDAVRGAGPPLADLARSLVGSAPDRPVFANLDAAPHPADPGAIAERLGRHVASPVRFAEMIEGMHRAGGSVFVEVGPGSALTSMVGAILAGRPHLAVATDAPRRPGIPALLQALARLAANGVALDPSRLFAGRDARRIDPESPPTGSGEPPLPASTWLVNGSRARPIDAPEPRRLGQAVEPPAPPEPRNGDGHKPGRNGHHEPSSPNGVHRNGHPAMTSPADRPSFALSTHDGPESGRNGKNGHAHADPVPVAPIAPPSSQMPPGAGSALVMEAFQQTMRAFLETQKATMLAYLGGRAPAQEAEPAPRSAAPEAAPVDRRAPEAAPPPSIRPRPPVPSADERPRTIPDAPDPWKEETADSPPTPVSSPPPIDGREAITRGLVEIVRDRTGYPAEMLRLDLDLEADLGIDSIKRVEILGTLRETVAGLESAADSSLMDDLARARTLGDIVDRVDSALKRGDIEPPSPPEPAREEPERPTSPVRRLTLEAVEAPLAEPSSGLMRSGVVVVTDEGRGIAREVSERLRSEGHPVEILEPARVDLASPASVEAALEAARGRGPIAGIVHALPLRERGAPGLDRSAWSAGIESELKGLFLMARAASADLERAASLGGACLIAATGLGGAFASTGGMPSDAFPGQGGIAGLMKTLAREWPGVRTRVVDFAPSESAREIAERLAREALADDDSAEVGYRDGLRIRLRARSAPLDRSRPSLALNPGEPILLTGGARGITAAVARELARRWRPTLLLVGSSPRPSGEESPETAALEDPAALKAALLDMRRRAGHAIEPADLERLYRALLRERQIRSTLRDLERLGATVEYARADVRDADALGRVLEGWRQRFGDPVGLIHGAGVIHDKLLRDKTPESFDRVLGTKLDGALNLARLIRPDPLKFAAFFSSVAGRFGNRGQSDYSAANEALNKLAVWLDQRWTARVVSVNWGPWSGVGMVSDLEGHLGRRGLGMIPPNVGCAAMADELFYGRKGDVEVVIAGDLGSLDGPLWPNRPAAGVGR